LKDDLSGRYDAGSSDSTILAILQHVGEDITIINYLITPPSVETLTQIVGMLGIEAKDLVRKKEHLYIQQFQDKQYTNSEWIKVLSKYPGLMERPIVIKNGKAIIGRPPRTVETIL
jgi:arsenate reductase